MKNRTRRVRPSGCPACARRAPPTTLRTWCAEHGEKGARLLLEYDDYRRGVDDVMRVQNTWRGGNARADIDGKRGRPAAHLRLRRRRRREEKRIRKRARLAHHTSPRVIQHTAFVPPAHSSSTRPPSRYVTPQRSTREMSIRAAAPNMGPFTRLVCTNFRTLHTKYAPGPLLPTTDGRSAGGADLVRVHVHVPVRVHVVWTRE